METHVMQNAFQAFNNLAASLAIIGIPLALFKRPISILASGIIIYITLVHNIVLVESRYSLPAMPFVFLISCFVISCFWKSFVAQNKEKKIRIITLFSLGGASYILSEILTISIILSFFKQLEPLTACFINIIFKNVSIILVSISVYFLLVETLSKPKRLIVAMFSCFCFIILLNSKTFYDMPWREWIVSLSGSSQRIRQEIVVPRASWNNAKKASLKIDMEQSKYPIGKLLVLVNDEPVEEYEKELTVENEKFFYFEYEHLIKNPARIRRWFSIPLEISRLKKYDAIKIELLYEEPLHDKRNWIRVYGDYPVKNSDGYFIGPLFARNPFETSIHKYKEDGDYRINGKVKLLSTKTISNFYDGQKWSCLDLSEKPGTQNGQYRIRLEIIDNHGNSLIF